MADCVKRVELRRAAWAVGLVLGAALAATALLGGGGADDAPGAGLSERNAATAQVLDALRR